MSQASAAGQYAGVALESMKGPAGFDATATPRHIRPLSLSRALYHITNLPSAGLSGRSRTPGAQFSPPCTHVATFGIASPNVGASLTWLQVTRSVERHTGTTAAKMTCVLYA